MLRFAQRQVSYANIGRSPTEFVEGCFKDGSRISTLSVILSVVSRYCCKKAKFETTDTKSNPLSDP